MQFDETSYNLYRFFMWLKEPMGILFLIWLPLKIIASWRMFKKAGLPGWKSLIPIYSSYLLYKICWKPYGFWIVCILSINIVLLRAYEASRYDIEATILVFLIIMLIAMAILAIVFSLHLSKAYGHGIGFALGLLFLQPIFFLILGLGSSEFVENPVTGEKVIS